MRELNPFIIFDIISELNETQNYKIETFIQEFLEIFPVYFSEHTLSGQ